VPVLHAFFKLFINNFEKHGEITQDEFEKLLDELHGKGSAPGAHAAQPVAAPVASAPVDSGDITDDEFERLLDELHGAGKSPSASSFATEPETPKAPEPATPAPTAPSADSDLMTDEEFEKLLDELHGSGKGPSIEELDFATKPASANSTNEPAAPTQPSGVTVSKWPCLIHWRGD